MHKLLDFLNHPTKKRMNLLCVTGMVCAALYIPIVIVNCLNFIFSSSYTLFFFTNLLSLAMIIILLLTFAGWMHSRSFLLFAAVPYILLVRTLCFLYDDVRVWLSPAEKMSGSIVLRQNRTIAKR